MNIQINCKDTVKEDDLRFIFHNLKSYLGLYEAEKDDKFITRNGVWRKQSKGNFMMRTNLEIKCNGKTMYFKIRSDSK